MRLILASLIFAALAFVSSPVQAQTTFQKYLTINDSLCGISRISAASNGSIYASGTLAPAGQPGNFSGVLWKLTSSGNLQWTLRFTRPNTNATIINDVEALSDGGVLVVLSVYSTNASFQNEITRLDANGNSVWSTKLVGASDWGFQNIATVTGGLLLTGYSVSGAGASLVMKIDLSGNIIWTKHLDKIQTNPFSIVEAANGDLFLPARSNLKAAMLQLRANGEQVRTTQYDENIVSNFSQFTGCVKTANDSLVLIGTDVDGKIMLLKTNIDGAPGSSLKLGISGNTVYPIGAHSDPNGNIYLGILEDGIAPRAIFSKLAANLSTVWSKNYGDNSGAGFNFYNTAAQSNSGTFLMGGFFLTNGKEQGFLVRTNSDGDVEGACCPKNITLERAGASLIPQNVVISELVSQGLTENQPALGISISDISDLCTAEEQIQPDSTITVCPGGCVIFSMTNPRQGAEYLWEMQGGTPESSTAVNPGQVCYNLKGTYTVKLTEGGCLLDQDTVIVDNPEDLFPNAFAPGGYNKTFKPIIRCPVEEYQLQIFNRWGDIVFETFDINEAWDGNVSNKPAPMDVYIYRVQYYAVREGVRQLVYEAKKELTLIR